MNDDELATRSIKIVTDEFKYFMNFTPGFDTDYF